MIRKPCCAACEQPLNVRAASWMADFAQIGYACPACQTEISKYASDLRNDVIAEIRRGYDSYWQTYRDAIAALTKGKPRRYRLP